MVVEKNAPLQPCNTFGIAARAQTLVRVRSADDISAFLADPELSGSPVFVLGGGSNIILTGDVRPVVLKMEIKGRNLIEGVPRTISIDDSEIREALGESVATIVNAIRVALERTPPELSADISDRGIVLTGGGALLKNLDKRIREETGLPVSIAEDPLASVVLGTGRMLSDFRLLRKISID